MNGGSCVLHKVHAPTNESTDEKKNRFWNRLSFELSSIPMCFPVLICGDFNVRWEAQLEHESARLGKYVGGKGVEYLTTIIFFPELPPFFCLMDRMLT